MGVPPSTGTLLAVTVSASNPWLEIFSLDATHDTADSADIDTVLMKSNTTGESSVACNTSTSKVLRCFDWLCSL